MRLGLLLFLLSHWLFSQIESPPNGIKVDDSLYLDATEIANIHWLEYEYHVKRDSSIDFYASILPDTTLTIRYRPNYYRTAFYRQFPVIGITYDQALDYCQWRTDIINASLKGEGKSYRIRYRLPTAAEWEQASLKIDTLEVASPIMPIVGQALEQDQSAFVKDYLGDTVDIKSLEKAIRKNRKEKVSVFILDFDRPWYYLISDFLPKNIYYPEEQSTAKNPPKDFYNLIGNVAEMVSEPGIVKGGSWRHKLPVSFPSKQIPIDPKKAYDWVGFRCIAEIVPLD